MDRVKRNQLKNLNSRLIEYENGAEVFSDQDLVDDSDTQLGVSLSTAQGTIVEELDNVIQSRTIEFIDEADQIFI